MSLDTTHSIKSTFGVLVDPLFEGLFAGFDLSGFCCHGFSLYLLPTGEHRCRAHCPAIRIHGAYAVPSLSCFKKHPFLLDFCIVLFFAVNTDGDFNTYFLIFVNHISKTSAISSFVIISH